jgi:hypothetical protein
MLLSRILTAKYRKKGVNVFAAMNMTGYPFTPRPKAKLPLFDVGDAG